ncbi:MAG TPA: hypothetical protein ENN60_01805 [archaeon]|nr:hypothetical protein [archaeon]
MKAFFRGFGQGVGQFGELLVVLFNSLLLTLIYFLGVGPTSIIMKFRGKTFLEKKTRKASYWKTSPSVVNEEEEAYRMF